MTRKIITIAYTKGIIVRKMFSKVGLLFLLTIAIMIFMPNVTAAQKGSVMGQVTDATTGEAISGATVTIENIDRKTQSRIVSSRRESANIGSVISSHQMDRFTDYTVKDAMARVSGVQVGRRGTINLRGVGLARYNVTVDGQRIGSTGAGDRSFDLGSISTDMVRDIEVIKVLTPDMDADALAGSINLVTRLEPGGERQLNARLGGGGNTRYFPYTGANNKASLNYHEALRENLTLAVNLSHMVDHRGWESVGVGYDVADFGAGPVDVIERISPNLQIDGQNRMGGGIQLIFQPSEQVTWHIRGVINRYDRERTGHTETRTVNSDWLRVDTTGAEGEQGTHVYDLRFRDSEIRQFAVQAGARHLFDGFNLEYKMGWAQSRFDQEDYLFPFMIGGLDYTIDMEDRTRPTLQTTNIRLMEDGTINRVLIRLQDMNRIVDEHIDNRFSGRVDAEVPFGPALFKLGSSALLTYKDGNFSNETYNFRRASTLFHFGPLRSRTKHIKVFDRDEYLNPWLLNAHDARSFLVDNPEDMIFHDGIHAPNSHIWNYSTSEHIYAGYGMASIDLLDRLTILGGVRVEYASTGNEGNKIRINEDGGYEILPPSTQDINNTHLFPNAQLLFSPLAEMNVRMAYSKTIARPGFHHLAPFERINLQDTTLFRGNPHLDPVTSDNLDVMVEYYLGNTGIFSVGLFHKQLSGFVFERQSILTEGEFAGFEERTFQNSDETATIYGAEVSWQQYLDFLPGFLSNFGAYANYTWSRSVFDVAWRDEDVRMPGQSPHVVNAALDYTQGRFSTQVSWHWTAEILTHLQGMPRLAPSIDPNKPNKAVYLDHYEDGWTDVSASFRFRISDNFRFWADAYNLLGMTGVERLQYAVSRSDYPIEIDRPGGLGFKAGILFSL